MRKWLVRGLVVTVLIAFMAACVLWRQWTDPALVRQQVLDVLANQFPGADVTLEHASVRILGGVYLKDLRLLRRGDKSREDFFHVPLAILHHDKELLLDGKFVFRRIELHRPRLRIVRRRDGSWNLSGLVSQSQARAPLPSTIVHDGTLYFEDRQLPDDLPPLVFTGLQMTMRAESPATVAFTGKGNSATFGKMHIEGVWNRQTGKTQLALRTDRGKLTTALLKRLARGHHQEIVADLVIQAEMELQLQMTIDPGSSEPVWYGLQCKLRNGVCSHPKLPLPLKQIELEARLTKDLVHLKKLTALSGAGRIHADGWGRWPDVSRNFQGSARVERLMVCSKLCARLPSRVHCLEKMFKPRGPVTMEFDLHRENGEWLKQRCRLKPEKIEVVYDQFPYPVANLSGVVDLDLLKEEHTVDLQANGRHKRLRLTGSWKGMETVTNVDLRLTAKNVPIDESLLQALPKEYQPTVRTYHLKGLSDVTAAIVYQPGWKTYQCTYHVHFHGASLKWDHFPFPLGRVTADLHVYPHHWELKNFRGANNNGWVTIAAHSIPDGKEDVHDNQRVLVNISGGNIGIDSDLNGALAPYPLLADSWEMFSPTGKLNFAARIDRVPGREHDLEIAVKVNGCSVKPSFFPYLMSELSGSFHYHKNRVTMKGIKARHRKTRVSLAKGTIDISDKGAMYADLQGLAGHSIHPNDGFFKALPHELRKTLYFIDKSKPITVNTRLIVARKETIGGWPDIYWDGMAWFRDSKLDFGVQVDRANGVVACVGRHDGERFHGIRGHAVLHKARVFGQPFTDVHARLHIDKKAPETLLVGLKAPIFGGDVAGQVRVDFNSTTRYALNLTASQIDLRRFGRHNLNNDYPLKGKASARLYLKGQGTGYDSLEGNGSVDVPEGKLLNLPWLLELLKFLGLRWPERTAFEEAHARFDIRGKRLHIKRLDLWGNAISLSGEGQLNLDGTDVQLEFYPSWARVEQILPRGLRELSPQVSKNLLKIEARGRIGSPKNELKFHKRPIPFLVDPLKKIHKQIRELEPHRQPFFKVQLWNSRQQTTGRSVPRRLPDQRIVPK